MTTKVSFKLPAELVAGAEQGMLLGEFNNWNIQEGIYLKKMEDGSMGAELVLAAGQTYEYRYLLSDGRWVNDNNGKKFSSIFGNAVENCIIEVPLPEKKEVVKKATAVKKGPKKTMPAKVDDFLKIEGINKKVMALLNTNGISSFSQLSKCSIKKLQLILDTAGDKFNVFNPAGWPKQAKLAAAGKWDELAVLQKASSSK